METDEKGIITRGTYAKVISEYGYVWAKDQHTADVEAVKAVVNREWTEPDTDAETGASTYQSRRELELYQQGYEQARSDILTALKAEIV
mgnify:CR=1 FL=1